MAASSVTRISGSPVLVGPFEPARPALPRRYFVPQPGTQTRGAEPHGTLGLGGLRLTARGRVVVGLLALLVALPVVGLGGRAVAKNPGTPVEVTVHTVAPGETLWHFARELAEPGQDVRPVVNRIKSLNELESAALQIGQTILLPVA